MRDENLEHEDDLVRDLEIEQEEVEEEDIVEELEDGNGARNFKGETLPEPEEKKEKVIYEKQVIEKPNVTVVVKHEKKRRSIFSIVFNIVFWLAFFAWAGICAYDFINVQQEKEPMFFISKKTITYNDGFVDECTGLGYKVYNYQRDSYMATEFGPFWITDRSANQK